MITQDSMIKIGLPVGTILPALAAGFYWLADYVATKDDIEALQNTQTSHFVEMTIQLTELQIRPLESVQELTPAQEREYEQLKTRLQRLLDEKDRILRQ